ncbi:MAG: BlaI/MecI/CopY family transcriptional regulator [Verrucomicrobiales bacterium]
MAASSDLSRRERQIMDLLYAKGEASVLEIQAELPEAPTSMAVRRMMHILEEKGAIMRRKEGREFIYRPKQARKRAGSKALKHVLETFFEGSLEQALATHLGDRRSKMSDREVERLMELIEQERNEGN